MNYKWAQGPSTGRCEVLVWNKQGTWRHVQCRHKAKSTIIVDGKERGVCGVHHPDSVQKRKEKVDKRWEDRYARSVDGEFKAALEKIASGKIKNPINYARDTLAQVRRR